VKTVGKQAKTMSTVIRILKQATNYGKMEKPSPAHNHAHTSKILPRDDFKNHQYK
jgi:hypothetical protein